MPPQITKMVFHTSLKNLDFYIEIPITSQGGLRNYKLEIKIMAFGFSKKFNSLLGITGGGIPQ